METRNMETTDFLTIEKNLMDKHGRPGIDRTA